MHRRYGFLLPPLTADEASMRQAAITSASQVKQWAVVKPPTAGEGLAPRRQSLKLLVRKGIPPSLRPAWWLWLSGAEELRSRQPAGYYQALSGPLSLDVLYIVEQAARTTLRQHPAFVTTSGLAVLQRLVHAYLQHNPAGYITGIAGVAAFAALVMGLDHEEDAFWLLVALLEHRLYPGGNQQLSTSVLVEQRVLDRLVQEKLPRVYAHLLKLDCTPATLTSDWFSSVCVGVLPAEAVARVWDGVVSEGIKVLHRVALALLMRYESTILSCSDMDRLKKVLSSRTKRLQDVDSLVTQAFRRVGSLSSGTISGLRTKAAQQVDAQASALVLRLELLSAA